MAQFTYYPETKLFNNIPPNINNLNHDIQKFLRHRFGSAYYAQSWSVKEPAFATHQLTGNDMNTQYYCHVLCKHYALYKYNLNTRNYPLMNKRNVGTTCNANFQRQQ
jgi:hypothetical protein